MQKDTLMRLVIQRVSHAKVTINGQLKSAIDAGMLVLVAVEDEDGIEDIEWLSSKLVNLRIFDDASGVMNRSVLDVAGEVLVVSQFTLFASTRKGNRPSYMRASRGSIAMLAYKRFVEEVERLLGREVKTGEFGADMQVELVNDGPVTIIIDSHLRE